MDGSQKDPSTWLGHKWLLLGWILDRQILHGLIECELAILPPFPANFPLWRQR